MFLVNPYRWVDGFWWKFRNLRWYSTADTWFECMMDYYIFCLFGNLTGQSSYASNSKPNTYFLSFNSSSKANLPPSGWVRCLNLANEVQQHSHFSMTCYIIAFLSLGICKIAMLHFYYDLLLTTLQSTPMLQNDTLLVTLCFWEEILGSLLSCSTIIFTFSCTW